MDVNSQFSFLFGPQWYLLREVTYSNRPQNVGMKLTLHRKSKIWEEEKMYFEVLVTVNTYVLFKDSGVSFNWTSNIN